MRLKIVYVALLSLTVLCVQSCSDAKTDEEIQKDNAAAIEKIKDDQVKAQEKAKMDAKIKAIIEFEKKEKAKILAAKNHKKDMFLKQIGGQEAWDWLSQEERDKLTPIIAETYAGRINGKISGDISRRYKQFKADAVRIETAVKEEIVEIDYNQITPVYHRYHKRTFKVKEILKANKDEFYAVVESDHIKRFVIKEVNKIINEKLYKELIAKANTKESLEKLAAAQNKFDFKPLGHNFDVKFKIGDKKGTELRCSITAAPKWEYKIPSAKTKAALSILHKGKIIWVEYIHPSKIDPRAILTALFDQGLVIMGRRTGTAIIIEDPSGHMLDASINHRGLTLNYFNYPIWQEVKILADKLKEERVKEAGTIKF